MAPEKFITVLVDENGQQVVSQPSAEQMPAVETLAAETPRLLIALDAEGEPPPAVETPATAETPAAAETPAVQSTPEPSSIAALLVVVASAGVAWRRRRRQAAFVRGSETA